MPLLHKLVLNPVAQSNRVFKWVSICQANKFCTSPKVLTISEEAKKALKSFSDIKYAPAPALFYGVAGLIPFTAIPTYMIQTGAYIPEMAFSSLAYSAVILSFIGGVRWGSAVSNPDVMNPSWKNFTSSIAPSVIAWISLLISNPAANILVICGFCSCLLQDMTSTQCFPSWYISLRILLSTIAICALLATAVCQYLLPLESSPKQE